MDDKSMLMLRTSKWNADTYFRWSNDMEVIMRGKELWKYSESTAP